MRQRQREGWLTFEGCSDRRQALEDRLAALIARSGVPGIATTIRWPGGDLSGSSGVSSSRSGEPLTDQGRFPISCVMKPMVALLVLHGHLSGRLDLDTKIDEYLPELGGGRTDRSAISIRHLLTHTAGYVEPRDNSARWGYNWEKFAEFFPARKQAFAPGAVWSYTHSGYAILAKVLEAVHRRDLGSILTELILGPLGIELILYSRLPAAADGAVSLHVRSPRTGSYEPMRPPTETGFLRYSISDFTLSASQICTIGNVMCGALDATLPHLEAARRYLLTPAVALPPYCYGAEGERMPTGFSHGVADYDGLKGVNGSYVGSTCSLRFQERVQFSSAVVINAWAPHARDVATRWTRQMLGLAPETRPQLGLVVEDIAEFEGEYEGLMLGAGGATVRREGEALICQIRRRGIPDLAARLERTEQGTLMLAEGSAECTLAFARDPGTGAPYLMIGTSACAKEPANAESRAG